MSKSRKPISVFLFSLPDGIADICEGSEEADVTTETALSIELALQKIRGRDEPFNMLLLSSNESRYVELMAAAKERNPGVVIIGFSNDPTSLSLMIDDGCNNAVRLGEAENAIEDGIDQLVK